MSVMLDDLGISSLRQTDVMKRLAGNSQLVSDAVADANRGWSENTALTTEVDNRNNSLAAKFEILKNKAVAVAEQFGGPLADALLSAVDAAAPLFEAIDLLRRWRMRWLRRVVRGGACHAEQLAAASARYPRRILSGQRFPVCHRCRASHSFAEDSRVRG